MYIGLGIFLLVVGAILRFAITASVSFINLQMIGVIMMIGGIISIIVSFVQMGMSRHRSVELQQTQVPPPQQNRPPQQQQPPRGNYGR